MKNRKRPFGILVLLISLFFIGPPTAHSEPWNISTLAFMCQLNVKPAPAQLWSVGFYTPWGSPPLPISDILWSGLTHVAMYGAVPNADGSLTLTFPDMASKAPALVTAAHSNDVKVLLSIWQNGPGGYHAAVRDHRAALVDNIMDLVDTYGFDGVDIDWETNFDEALCEQLLSDLRTRLGTRHLNICVGVFPDKYTSLHPYVDRMSVMTYDLAGPWDPYSWHNSALYSAPPGHTVWSHHLMRLRYEAAGIPLSKLCTGLAFYGKKLTGVAAPQIANATYTIQSISYQSILTQYDTTQASWDDDAHVPWLPVANGYITYDNEQSIKEKVNYVQDNGLGGWIIWALDSDYMPDQPIKSPLLNAVSEAMNE